MIICIVSQTKLLSNKDLVLLSQAMQQSAFDCARIWGLEAPGIVAVDSFDELKRLPTCHPIVLAESNGEDVLGYHYWDVFRKGPAGRVLVDVASGVNSGDYSVCETLSHEVVEAMVDPRVNTWMDWPGHAGSQMALEVADMTQDWYAYVQNGSTWRLANFVTPAYFDPRLLPDEARARFLRGDGRFDMARELSRPGEIGVRGYAIVRGVGEWKNRAVFGGSFKVNPGKLRNGSRSGLRGVDKLELTSFPDYEDEPTVVRKLPSINPRKP